MDLKILSWFSLVSVITIGLCGFSLYFTLLIFIVSFSIGLFTIFYFDFNPNNIFSQDLDRLEDPLQEENFYIQLPKVLEEFQKAKKRTKFDNRITGSDSVDSFLNEIITIIINDYVTSWYEIVTDDDELTSHAIKKLVLSAGANVANRVKCVDWIHLLSTKFPEELTTHLKMFKQSRVRLKHINLISAKEIANGCSKGKGQEDKKMHRRNKSETDLLWSPGRSDYCSSQTAIKSNKNGFKEELQSDTSTEKEWLESGDSLDDLSEERENKYGEDEDVETSDLEKKKIKEDKETLKKERDENKAAKVAHQNKKSKESTKKDKLSDEHNPAPKRKMRRLRINSDCEFYKFLNTQTYGKSKFYGSNEEIGEKSLTDLFFDLECSLENREICRDIFCTDPEREYALLCEVSETVLYLVGPEEAWKCHAMKMLLVELLASVVLRPLFELLSDPDTINRAILKYGCKDSTLPSDIFLLVVRCSGDAEELDATMELVQKDIQKLHSKDSAGEWEIQDRQKLSSLQYLSRIIQARRATLGPQEGLNNANTEKMSEEVARSLKFLREMTSWRSNAQYLLEIELNEADATHTSKAVIDNLRSSALELCDLFLAPNKPPVMGLPENCHADLVRKITTEGEEFTNNPVVCFDDVQKCVCDALEDDPSWQADFMMDHDGSNSDIRRDDRNEKKYGEMIHIPGRHNRSRSDIVGNTTHKTETSGPSNYHSAKNNNLSLSHSNISQKAKNHLSPLSASIIETALVQDKGKTFGIYAIAVTRLSDNEEWHIYRRYSDFYDMNCAIKDKWPELSSLPFPAKKTFSNTSRSVLESRKRMLNNYLQTLATIARETRYMALWSHEFLGGLLSSEAQTEKHNHTIDGLLVNSLKAGMRTLKNMPDQFVNTVDGMMDGISKVFQSKGGDNNYDALRSGNSSDGQDDGDESIPLRLLEEVLGIRGLWLRRRLLAPLRTLIGDRVNRKVLELVSSLTSPRNVVQYLKTFKSWLTYRNNASYSSRETATKARTRVAAKVALLSACSDDLRHIVGTDTARRGLLTLFDMFQTREINRRLVFVLLECILIDLFPDNHIQEMFKKIYTNSPRVPAVKKSVNV